MSQGFVGIQQAMDLPGLRLVLLRGMPSPWSQAARGIFHVKGVPFVKVHLAPGEPRELLRVWTGQDAYPAAMYGNERPRTSWEEILWLAERLGPEPSLVPRDPEARAQMFGLARELCGEMGLGWCRRLMAMAPILAKPDASRDGLGYKYRSSPAEVAEAEVRIREILGLLVDRLEASRARGGRYLLGDRLTALDVYWATFCNLLAPLPEAQMALPETLRPAFTTRDAETRALLDRGLLAHRDFVYETHLELPVEL
ncbi:MAG: glutathione S-transferase C-terminal domain-containing protein [Spirochaetaceae bacterium]|nr:glutathione S-transferase C-terminal domain-containing protein [Myxococcales bacterium]MCB9725917.1 glutathione S-transferase C-terminal domain-containing protein [Spirochaetaceae bacterium]